MKLLRRIIITIVLFCFCFISGCSSLSSDSGKSRFSFFPALFSSQGSAPSGRLTAQTEDSIYFFCGDERGESVRGIYCLKKGAEPGTAELVARAKNVSAITTDGEGLIYYCSIVSSEGENKNKLIELNLDTCDYQFTYQVPKSRSLFYTSEKLYSLSYTLEPAADSSEINAYRYYSFKNANLASPSVSIDTDEGFEQVELDDMSRILSFKQEGNQMISYITKDDLQVYDLNTDTWVCASNIYAPTVFVDAQTAFVQTRSRTGPLLEVKNGTVTEHVMEGENAHYTQINYLPQERALVLFNTYNYFGNYQENEREYVLKFDVTERVYESLYQVSKQEIVLYADLNFCLIYDRQSGEVAVQPYGGERYALFETERYVYGLEVRDEYAFFYYSAGLDENGIENVCLYGVYRLTV